ELILYFAPGDVPQPNRLAVPDIRQPSAIRAESDQRLIERIHELTRRRGPAAERLHDPPRFHLPDLDAVPDCSRQEAAIRAESDFDELFGVFEGGDRAGRRRGPP